MKARVAQEMFKPITIVKPPVFQDMNTNGRPDNKSKNGVQQHREMTAVQKTNGNFHEANHGRRKSTFLRRFKPNRWWRRPTSASKTMDWRRFLMVIIFSAAAVTLMLSCTAPFFLSHFLSPSKAVNSSFPTKPSVDEDEQFNLYPEVTVSISSPNTSIFGVPPARIVDSPLVGDVLPLEGVDRVEEESQGSNDLVTVSVLSQNTSDTDAPAAVTVDSPQMEDVLPLESVNKVEEESEGSNDLSPGSLVPSVDKLKSKSNGRSDASRLVEALLCAKMEIDRAPPVILDDPELHAPLFRNVSIFKRSYELMERILKVYVYKDGGRPIFHTPPIKGIYASEGWFMKLMERNRQLTVKDPKKAHLFYLPYSAHQLELALYVPDAHNMRDLSLFLKNYVNKIAAKYPFWNRTHGSDHFLVACHDWGPYTTKEHDELFKNTIKALCNADLSEGIFVRGRDVSLPETAIAVPRRPHRDLGGKPLSQRNILAFYAGYLHGRVRLVLLKYWGGNDEDMRIYGPLPKKISTKMSYAQHMKSSKFCICPMGYEVNSPRIVEAIYYECVPVIIADNFVLPFDDVLDWSRFSVIVPEKNIPNLKDILLAVSPEQYVSMQTNIQRLQKHFLWHTKPIKYDIFHMILHSIWFNRLNHIVV